MLFIQKKDGSMHMCIDYMYLNKLIVKKHYSMARIDDLFDQFHSIVVFYKIDLRSITIS